MKMPVFWVVALRCLAEVYKRFINAFDLIMEAAGSSSGCAFLQALYRAGSRRELDLMVLIGGVQKRASNQHKFTLKMANTILPKRWIILNIRRGSYPKAEIKHCISG
jgi:hypothetical protein